jgi:hypothetical protein
MAGLRIPAFLMSLLARQHALMGDAFVTRYAHPWLVWEPGEWSVPKSGVDVSVAETRLPEGYEVNPRPLGGDALCFALKAPDGAVVRVGRAADNEIVISDMTVSRLHARFEKKGEGWALVPLSETKATRVGGKSASSGVPQPVSSGTSLELGGVKMAFYDAAAFRARVASVPLRPAR